MGLKPGYRSTEFYGHGAATVIGAIAATGFLNPDLNKIAADAVGAIPDAVVIINSIVDGIMQLAGLAISIISPVKYGTGRAQAKKMPEKVIIRK